MNLPTQRLAPVMRQDLIISPVTLYRNRRRSVVIKDPAARRYFSISENEFAVLQLCNGVRSYDEILELANQRPIAKISYEWLIAFLAQITKAGLVSELRTEQEIAPGIIGVRIAAVLRKVLYVQLKTISPDRFLTWGTRFMRPIFTGSFVSAASALILLAMLAIVLHKELFHGMFATRISAIDFSIAWTVCLVFAVIHEFSHGFACKYWGGSVHSMGLLFIYFNPALYCDVSDAWMFERRFQRLWTMAAGGFIESILWAGTVFLYTYLPMPTHAQAVARFVILFTGFKIVVNLNPLLKLDGYYMLSDALSVPNLRRKAFLFTRLLLKSRWMRTAMPSVSSRDAIVYLLYSFVAGPFSIWLAVTVLWRGVHAILGHNWWGSWALIVIMVSIFLDVLVASASWIRRRIAIAN